ncbi:hypothetical protein CPC08DRAFT_712475 [Agrocybe pediades]|nr:hypothetical protein CPC08DRAFT_712475 [Agrocybe pediades]
MSWTNFLTIPPSCCSPIKCQPEPQQGDFQVSGAESMFDIPSTFGATLLGSFVSCALYGLTAVQTWFYFASYPKDPLRSKLLVSTLCLLDTIHTVLTSYTTYFYLVTHYYSPSSLLFIHWSIPVSVMVSNTIEIIVQSYFLHKIIILSRGTLLWRALASLIGILVVAHLGAAVGEVIAHAPVMLSI